MKVRKFIVERDIPLVMRHYSVGGLGFVLNYTLFNVLLFMGLKVAVANAINCTGLFFVFFLLQKHFTYKVKADFTHHLFLFIINALFFYFVETSLLILLINKLGVISLVSKGISLLTISPLNFLSQKYIVFRKKVAASGGFMNE
ncbi:MAG: GtrA family protein [Candidatus Vogelbacteria bacterium]|nr:GtrA family protein [Candidatus Vogelbacteria bacterium]